MYEKVEKILELNSEIEKLKKFKENLETLFSPDKKDGELLNHELFNNFNISISVNIKVRRTGQFQKEIDYENSDFELLNLSGLKFTILTSVEMNVNSLISEKENELKELIK